ncbi:MAG: hypothetical protein EBS56_04330 [Planctomycetia bacterium]|nr:hypothetical protein [Planctomycetia bacterium]
MQTGEQRGTVIVRPDVRSIVVSGLLVAWAWGGAAFATETYVTADALFLQRDNESNERPLAVDSNTGATAVGTSDLRFPVAGGVRLFVGRHTAGGCGWEVGYLGVYGMTADASAAGNGGLDIAPDLSDEVASLRNASLADCSYTSAINGFEANLTATSEHVHRPRETAYAADGVPSVATIDWLAGFRWAGLEEAATIGLTTPGLGTSQYGVRASSNLFGGQLGVRGRIDWERWSLEGQGKAALAGVVLAQSQAPIVDAFNGFQERPAQGAEDGGVGGIFDWNVAVIRRVGEHWSIRAGYTMLWLTGVALAPDQFDFSIAPGAGTNLVGGNMIWLQGATLGLEGRW